MILDAQEKLGADKSKAPKGPRMRDYSPMLEALYRVADAVNSNTAAVVAAAGIQPRAVEPQARPQTAFDVVEHQKKLEGHRSLVARVLPNG